MIIMACIAAGLFLVFGIAVQVWGLQGLIADISGDFSVITNGAGNASIIISCSTDNFQKHSGYCDGNWVGGIEEDCEGDWVPERQNCCVGGAGWVDPWTEYASITKCETDFGCSCTGGTSCSDDTCIKDFAAGILDNDYTVTVNAKDSLNYTASDSYDITVDTRVFEILSIESEGGIMDPRSKYLTINTSLPIDAASGITGNITFAPSDAASIASCSIEASRIVCTLIKQGTVHGADVYWKPEYTSMTVKVPAGLVVHSPDATHKKSLLSSDHLMSIGCVLRKVTLASQPNLPGDDILVKPDDLWGSCNASLGQQYRRVKLRELNCNLTEVEEMRGCQQTPVVIKKVIRTDYTDLSATVTQDDKDSGFVSFGPLKSAIIVKGDYFYSVQGSGWSERTFTEVWMGKNPAIKIAGIGYFSRAPFLSSPNGIDVSFVSQPVCDSDLKNCTMQVQIRQETPECADKVEIRAVVQPQIYQIDKIDPLKWDDGNQPWGENLRQEKMGDAIFTVVPSSFDGSKFRGARFNFAWADQKVNSKVIDYLTSIGAKQNQGMVGLPLSFTLENDYEDKAVSPRYCAVPNDDKTVCSLEQVDSGNCQCGFGRKNYQDDVTTDFIKIKFYNGTSADPAESKKIIRPEKEVLLWEVGKPWNKFKIFPIAPFLDEKAKPGITRAYVCGNNIGFIESRENFELLGQDISNVFAVSLASPFWGDDEAGYPFVWGYNLKPEKGSQIIAKIDTWQGKKDISFVPIGPTYGYLILPSDDFHPKGTALGDLEFCRDDFCVKSHQNIYKEKYNPAGEGRGPEIESASMLTNWQAQPFPIYEDIPYVENFCIDEEVVIQGSDFGEDRAQVLFWQDRGWSIPAAVSIESWSKDEIKVKIQSNSIGKSADCAKAPHTLAEVSDLTLPAKICDITGKCQISDQNHIKTIPPRRVHLVDENALEKDNYCLDDRILITGLEFGKQRLGAKIKITGQEVGRYIKWSDSEIIVTPPPIYSGKRSPFCPRTDERNKDGLLTTVKKSDQTTINCPNLPSGPRKCQISKVELVLPYSFQSAPVYKYQDDFKYFSNICLDDKLEISGHDFGEEQGASRVEFWSNENGWDEARQYLSWLDDKVAVLLPAKSWGQSSPDCPRGKGSDGSEPNVSIFKGSIRVCATQECQYFGLDSTNVNSKIKIYKKVLTNKQYLVDEEIKITGRFFSDVQSEDEFKKSGADPNDKRNTGYVEFYNDEIGWIPAGEYVKWTDQEIITKAPKISFENIYGGHDSGVSAAGQPVRICTYSGCSTNLVNYQKQEITESIFDDPNWTLKGFNFGSEDELGRGSIVYKIGDWWKQAIIIDWSDQAVSFSFQGDDRGEILRFCRADEKCLFWDLGAKQEIIWHYPEVFSVSPICIDKDPAIDQLITVFGKDLDYANDIGEQIITGGFIELDDGHGTRVNLEIYNDQSKKFKQQYYDRLVLKISAAELGKILIPLPPDPKQREFQALIGTMFLNTKFAHKNKIEVNSAIAFSNYCQQEISCLNAPMITATNNKSYVGEDKDKAVSLAPDSTAIISGCNLGSGQGSSIAFGDVYQFNDLAARSNWQTNSINIATPFGAKSGFLASNIWTGLIEYSTVWLSDQALAELSIQPRTNLLFNVLPTIGELGVSLGSTGQIVEIFSSDFCGPFGCADFLKDVYLGVWQAEQSENFDLTGAPMRILDVGPRRVRVKITNEDQLKTYGDVYANLDKMAVSSQFLIKRGDDALSAPILKTANFDSYEFLDNTLYFTKTPVLKEILPNPIYKIDKNEVYFKGADYYGTENVSRQLKSYFNGFAPHGEFALSEPYDLADTDVFARSFQYPDLADLKKEAYKQAPDYIWAWNEVDRRPYFDNPQSVILSNWDGAFSAWLEGAYKDPKVRPAYSIIEVKEQQCMVREPLSEPQSADMPSALPAEAEPLGIHKIDPLPLLDVCYFCKDQEVKILAQDQTSFKADKGQVYFWSDSGWIEVQIIFWSANEARVKLTNNQDIKHLKCGDGKLTQARLPIKLCRKVDDSDPEECIVWRGPKTHIKIKFASGGVSQDYKRTLGRFNRLNLEQSLVFAGDNLIEKVFIDEDYSDNFGAVELFINKLYNDIKNDIVREQLYGNIFSPFSESAGEVGLIWVDEFNSTNLYNSGKRYLVCFDDECQNTGLVYPEFLPGIGGFYQGKEIKQVKFFSKGWVSDAAVRLEEGARP